MNITLTNRFIQDAESNVELKGFYLLTSSNPLNDDIINHEITEELLSGQWTNFKNLIPLLVLSSGSKCEVSVNTADIDSEFVNYMYLVYKIPFLNDKVFVVNKSLIPYERLKNVSNTQLVLSIDNFPKVNLWNNFSNSEISSLCNWTRIRFRMNYPAINTDELLIDKEIL